MTSRPSSPPSSAITGSNDAAIGQGRHDIVSDVREVGQDQVERTARRHRGVRQQVGSHELDRLADRMRDRVLAGEVEGVIGDVGRDQVDGVEGLAAPEPDRKGHDDRATPGANVDDTDCAILPPVPPRRRRTSPSASSTRRSVSGRGISARASTENASP